MPGADDLLLVVDVVDEAVQRRHALRQALLHLGPLVRRDHARDQVERDQALGAGAVLVLRAVDGEGDADAAEDHLGLFAARLHHVARLLRQPAVVAAVVLAHRGAGGLHLVEAGSHRQRLLAGRVAKSRPLTRQSGALGRRRPMVPVAACRVTLADRWQPEPSERQRQAPQSGLADDRRRRARGSARAPPAPGGRSGCGSRPGRPPCAAAPRPGTPASTRCGCRGAAPAARRCAAPRRARPAAPAPARARCRRSAARSRPARRSTRSTHDSAFGSQRALVVGRAAGAAPRSARRPSPRTGRRRSGVWRGASASSGWSASQRARAARRPAAPPAARRAPPTWSMSRWLSTSRSMRVSPRARSSGSSTRWPASLSREYCGPAS